MIRRKNEKKSQIMHSFKFRAWDKSKKQMYHDFNFIQSGDNSNDWMVFTSDETGNYEKNKNNPYFSAQLEIEQYTGIKDSNGVDIYEGDIVSPQEAKKNYPQYEILYDEGIACFIARNLFDKTALLNPGMNTGTMKYYKIIGNIHENLELLERRKK